MNDDVVEAVRLGQMRSSRSRRAYEQDCVELAVDELLRHPFACGEPKELLAKSMAHARTHLRRRRLICSVEPMSDDIDGDRLPRVGHSDEERRAIVDLDDWLIRSSLSSHGIVLLRAQLHALTPEELARGLQAPVTRVREQLARARRAASQEWMAAA